MKVDVNDEAEDEGDDHRGDVGQVKGQHVIGQSGTSRLDVAYCDVRSVTLALSPTSLRQSFLDQPSLVGVIRV